MRRRRRGVNQGCVRRGEEERESKKEKTASSVRRGPCTLHSISGHAALLFFPFTFSPRPDKQQSPGRKKQSFGSLDGHTHTHTHTRKQRIYPCNSATLASRDNGIRFLTSRLFSFCPLRHLFFYFFFAYFVCRLVPEHFSTIVFRISTETIGTNYHVPPVGSGRYRLRSIHGCCCCCMLPHNSGPSVISVPHLARSPPEDPAVARKLQRWIPVARWAAR